MPTFEDDWIAFPHAVGLIEALAALMQERLLPTGCFVGVLPGADIALDYISDECDSMAYSRVASIFPSSIFPNQDASPSPMITMASNIELGILRGATVPDNGEAPTAEQQYDMARLQLADMQAMLDTICAYCDAHELPVLIGSYAPLGPDGGVVGGIWTATIGAA